jgi:3-hydroxyisobutyrate dehydrogenase
MAVIAYFGTGLLGSGFVRKMLERGETVHVWNRTIEKARALEADGAKVFDNPADAARGAAEIHLTLSDDDAVDSVLEPLASIVLPTAFIADHTTTAPTPTGERVRRWTERGRTFVHAPVFMGPQNARDGTGLMLLSGDPATRARVKPRLEPMTGKVLELGDDPTRAASFKLFGNLMLLVIAGGLADTYRLGRSLGIEPKDAFTLFSEFNPGNAIGGRGKSMSEGKFTPPNFELAMARKDLRLMIDEAARHGEKLDVVPAVAALCDRYLAAGHGSEDVGVIAAARP